MTALVALPGVYRPRSDSFLLMRALLDHAAGLAGRSVLDLCTGSGLLAVAAARAGADVLAVDLSRRAAANARLNARLNGVRIRAVAGDLWQPVHARRFDVIVSNPPYLPAVGPASRAGVAWDAGPDGRALLDPICRGAAAHLRPGGRLLLVHSSLADPERSRKALAESGLSTRTIALHRGPLGPVASARRELLGLEPDATESLVVMEAVAPLPGAQAQSEERQAVG